MLSRILGVLKITLIFTATIAIAVATSVLGQFAHALTSSDLKMIE
jgi:hypothetical protein